MPEIEIIVNGQQTRVPEGLTVLNVLKALGLEPSRVALEYEGSILKTAEWPDRVVHPGARLEIVHFVGGG